MQYDAILIGSGQSAPSLAVFLATLGQKVAIIEGATWGGSCVNYGCTPTKTLRKSARVAHMVARAGDFGVQVGDVRVDFGAVMARMRKIVGESSGGLRGWLESTPNLIMIEGWAQFDGREADGSLRVLVNDTVLTTPNVYRNTGTRAFIPPIVGMEGVPYLDNVSLMDLEELPAHLLILGGGYIGLEMGQIFARLGSEVSLIEGAPHVAFREDADVIAPIEAFLSEDGVTLWTGHQAIHAERTDAGITLTLEAQDGTQRTLTGTHLLVATGRTPNTDTLNLASIGLETDKRGYITTTSQLETAVAGVWALGDINGRGAFTHTSYHDYEIVRDTLLGKARSADQRVMAYAMFTDPPLGRVGMSEADARKSGRNVLMATHAMANVSRAKEESEKRGIIKLLVDADTEQFLGATFLGIGGDEIVQVISNYMATGASYRLMRDTLPVHPTVTEFLPTILDKLAPLTE